MTADPRRALRASSALRDGASMSEACRSSGLSYGTVVRIRTEMRRSGLLPAIDTPRAPAEPPRRDLPDIARQLSRAILRSLSAAPDDIALSFAAPAVLALPSRQTAILDLLMQRAGRIVTRADIQRIVYDDMRLHEKNLDVQISRLRVKLAAHGVRITTHPTVGYSLSREDRDRLEALDCTPVALPPLPCMARRTVA